MENNVDKTECIDLSLNAFRAVIFDLDGVVTDTASLHADAWKRMFDDFLKNRNRRGNADHAPFDAKSDYLEHVDGKPRNDGVADFLHSRGIELPMGTPDDPPAAETVRGLGNRKNALFQELLSSEAVKTYDNTLELIRRLLDGGVRTAVVSSSKNCREILAATGIADLFQQLVDGRDSEALGLNGKPAPDIFLEAARRLGVDPAQAVVVEDAQSGVQAGKKGGFGCVIGVDRGGQAEALYRKGADAVVADLGDVSIDGVPVRGGAGRTPLPPALENIDRILEAADGRRLAVFLDYDGTLTPIVEKPEDANLSPDARRIVRDLAREAPVAVISGRDLRDVRRRVDIDRLYYAGSHGFDIDGPADRPVSHQPGSLSVEAVDEAEKRLEERLEGVEGAQVERKRFSVAVHYRRVSGDDVEKVSDAVDAVLEQVAGLKKSAGKKVFELRPDLDWDKGRAVRWLMEKAIDPEGAGLLPVYIGDDVTDEDAFRELKADGVGIRVGRSTAVESHARYRLADPAEVHRFLRDLREAVDERRTHRDWRLIYEGFDPPNEGLRETLCALGNGYFCTRGAAPESSADAVHYPGTYLAGGYNRLKSEIAGRIVENEDLVNMPNWLPLSFRIDGGAWFSLSEVEVLDYRQELDIRHGVLHRRIRFRDAEGRVARVAERRIVSLDDVHLAALETTLTPENWSGTLEFRSALDGRVVNGGVARYRKLSHRHLSPMESGNPWGDTLFLKMETNQSRIQVAVAARTRAFRGGKRLFVKRRSMLQENYAASLFDVTAEPGVPVRLEKIAAVYSAKDTAISECGLEAREAVRRAPGFEALLSANRRAWHQVWQRFEISLVASDPMEDIGMVGMVVHLYVFHVLQTTSTYAVSMALDVGAPARGWHGEAYRGHVFWDELFVFPMINLRLPEITKALLMYRYRRLDAARRAAREAGHRGAMFPWQSGSNGREESQQLHLNPKSNRWIPDRSHRQRHVNAAIAYNVHQYDQVSRDTEFLCHYGAEMMLEIARFWSSIARYNPRLERYEILGVMGPDEYHDGYPGAEEGGLDNNAYTNVMAVWVLKRAGEMLDRLPADVRAELRDKVDLTDQELARWREITRRMRVVFHGDGIISQFEGYDGLEEFDWEGYREKYGDIQRLDRILEAENDTTNRYKASKQADVLMLFYLLSAEELREIFEGLGYPFDYETIPKNIAYYTQRTSHGSTLSRVVHAWVLARSDRPGSWHLFHEALKSDVSDIQGGTTPEGIHLGAMAGTVDQLQRGYTGIVTRDDVLWFDPCLPDDLRCLRFGIRYRQRFLEVEIDADTLTVSTPPGPERAIRIGFDESVHELSPGRSMTFDLAAEKGAAPRTSSRRGSGAC